MKFIPIALLSIASIFGVGCATTGDGSTVMPGEILFTPLSPDDVKPIVDILEILAAQNIDDPETLAIVNSIIATIRAGGAAGTGVSLVDAATIAALQTALAQDRIDPSYVMLAAIAADRASRLPSVQANENLHRLLVTIYNVAMVHLRERAAKNTSTQ